MSNNYNPDMIKVFVKDDFRQIPDIGDDKYYINSDGDVQNINTGKILKDRLDRNGYRELVLWTKDNPRKTFKVHRLVASAFIPNPNNYNLVCFTDEDRTNCESDNLYWSTSSDNVAKSISDGTHRMPDNRKWYRVYNTETGDSVECYGPKELAELIEYTGSMSHISNLTRNKFPLRTGPYAGYMVSYKDE